MDADPLATMYVRKFFRDMIKGWSEVYSGFAVAPLAKRISGGLRMKRLLLSISGSSLSP